MLRAFVALMAVGVVLYALTALTPQPGNSVAVATGVAKRLESLKTQWDDIQVSGEEAHEAIPDDLPASEVIDAEIPPQVVGGSTPAESRHATPPVRDTLQQTQETVTVPARHEDQYTERDVLAVNRDNAEILNRIEQLFNEH